MSTHPVLRLGDRLLLAPSHTGLDQPAWVVIELIERAPDPTALPWNAGANYPWRIGYRSNTITEGGDIFESRGMIWTDAQGNDAGAALMRSESAYMPAPTERNHKCPLRSSKPPALGS